MVVVRDVVAMELRGTVDEGNWEKRKRDMMMVEEAVCVGVCVSRSGLFDYLIRLLCPLGYAPFSPDFQPNNGGRSSLIW